MTDLFEGPIPVPTEATVLAYFHAHPAMVRPTKDALQWSLTHPKPFTWREARVLGRFLDKLLMDGILDYVEGGRYRFRDPQAVFQALVRYTAEQRRARETVDRGEPLQVPVGAPRDLFSELVGYETAKRITLMALSAPKVVHILYVGPPASGKSLFMEGVSTIPGAVYRFGDSVTKAGLRALLFTEKPPVLCIDEIDKMPDEESSALLEFMERQVVSQLNYRSNREESIVIRVFAAANRVERMRPELLSRFWKVQLSPYTYEEFVRVVTIHLSKRGHTDQLASFIANGVAERTRDVRDAVRIADMTRSTSDAEFLISQLGKEISV